MKAVDLHRMSQIHVNPNRPKTPVIRTRNVSPTIQDKDVYETVTDGRESETMVFGTGRDSAASVYGTVTSPHTVSDVSPLLNEDGTSPLPDSRSDSGDEEEGRVGPVLTRAYIRKHKLYLLKQTKIAILTVAIVICSVFIVINPEVEEVWSQTTLKQNLLREIIVPQQDIPSGVNSRILSLKLKGPFRDEQKEVASPSAGTVHVDVDGKGGENVTVKMPVLDEQIQDVSMHIDLTDRDPGTPLNISLTFLPSLLGAALLGDGDDASCVPIDYTYSFTSDLVRKEACAAIVLVLVYGLIIFDLVHRTLAAIIGSMAAIAVLSAFGMRPTLDTVMTWLDVETLSLLFGMMIIVAIFSETGFFDYCALMAYKIAKGQVWPLITLLCVFSAVVSAFLDNVTTILLLTPVTIRLCEVLNLDPRKILIAEVLFSNIGGTATAIGDPPNVIIVSHKDIKAAGIEFSNFTAHMSVGIVFVGVVGYGLLRLTYRKMEDLENKDPIEITELRHEIEMWRRAALRMVAISREENIMKAIFWQRVAELENKLIKKIYKMKRRKQKNFKEMLSELEKKYRITNKPLLIKSGMVLTVVILMFFLHSFITAMHVGLGWIALLGAVWLLVVSDIEELETILHRVEWSTLIFFAALFSMMKAMEELGLIEWIGQQVKSLIEGVDGDKQRLTVALLLIIWVSAVASSFIDNIPFTTTMIPILILLKNDPDIDLELLPIVLALAFGACLGGNGTLIGASANVVAAGIAEQHGYGFSFIDFFKVGFPMMLVTTAVATVYLLLCHVVGHWH